jgi:hypothetical protein
MEISRDGGSIPPASTQAKLTTWLQAKRPAGSTQRVVAFLPRILGIFRLVEVRLSSNRGTRLAPIAIPKGSNQSQRLETTGRPSNTSRARK